MMELAMRHKRETFLVLGLKYKLTRHIGLKISKKYSHRNKILAQREVDHLKDIVDMYCKRQKDFISKNNSDNEDVALALIAETKNRINNETLEIRNDIFKVEGTITNLKVQLKDLISQQQKIIESCNQNADKKYTDFCLEHDSKCVLRNKELESELETQLIKEFGDYID